MSLLTIPRDIHSNMWNENPHLIYLSPFSQLYNRDKSKQKDNSSKEIWCIVWLTHPDEEENKYYRLPDDEKLDVCQSFYSGFDIEDQTIKECIDKFPDLCLTLIENTYKRDKDQLFKISKFLNEQELDLENLAEIIKLKALMPKIYTDFDKIEKLFQKNKSEQRVHGGRGKTLNEKGALVPDE